MPQQHDSNPEPQEQGGSAHTRATENPNKLTAEQMIEQDENRIHRDCSRRCVARLAAMTERCRRIKLAMPETHDYPSSCPRQILARQDLFTAMLIVGVFAGDRDIQASIKEATPLIYFGGPDLLKAVIRQRVRDEMAAITDREVLDRLINSCEHVIDLLGGGGARPRRVVPWRPSEQDVTILGAALLRVCEIRLDLYKQGGHQEGASA